MEATAASTAVRFRAFAGWDDLVGMAAANRAHRARVGVLELIDDERMAHYYRHLPHTDLTRDVRIAEHDGRIVGYARASWSDRTDGSRTYESTVLVDPAVWGRGVGRELLAWCEVRIRAISADEAPPTTGDQWLQVYVTEGDEEIRPSVAASGYRVVRRGAEMLRPDLGDPLPDHPLPDGFGIRPLPDHRLREFWELTLEAFREGFDEPAPEESAFIAWRDDPTRDPSLDVIAFDGEAIASYVLNKLETAPDGSPRGLLDEVGTLPRYRRRGLARALVARSLRVLRDRGATSAYLGVDLQNPAQALTLYESCGFHVVTTTWTWRRPLDGVWPEETDR